MHDKPAAEGVMHKRCTSCAADKPVAEFHKQARGRFGVSSICKPCNKAKVYAYRKANPEKIKEIAARYRAAHIDEVRERFQDWKDANPDYERERYARRRADAAQLATLRAINARIGRERRAAIAMSEGIEEAVKAELLRQPCAYCWAPAVELDHVVPLSAGGRHDIANLVPSCRRCNARKGNKSLLMFLLAQRRSAERMHAHGAY